MGNNKIVYSNIDYQFIKRVEYTENIKHPKILSLTFSKEQFQFLPQDAYIKVKGIYIGGVLQYCEVFSTKTMSAEIAQTIFRGEDLTLAQIKSLSKDLPHNQKRKEDKKNQASIKNTPQTATVSYLLTTLYPEISVYYTIGTKPKIQSKTFENPEKTIEFLRKYEFSNSDKFVREIKNIKAKVRYLDDIVSIITQLDNRAKLEDVLLIFNKTRKKPVTNSALKSFLEFCKPEVIINNDGTYSARDYQLYKESNPLEATVEEDAQFVKEFNIVTKYHPVLAKEKPVYLGLDFGTSYTKIAYQFDPKNKGIIRFGDSFFKPTVVYFDGKDSLSMLPTNKHTKQIRFFKCTMVKDSSLYLELRYNNLNVPDNFETLCSVFFLSNIIRYAKRRLEKEYYCKTENSSFVAMGIPLSKNDANIEVYNRALHAALYTERQNTLKDIETLSLAKLQKFYDEAMTDIPFSNGLYDISSEEYSGVDCTIPELFTEALFVLKAKDYDEGFYYVVDIGGGTTDFAFIYKDMAFDDGTQKAFSYYCPSAVVTHLGDEVRKACFLPKKEKEYHERFGSAYYTTVGVAKLVLPIKEGFIVQQLFFGGGAAGIDNPYIIRARKGGVYQQYLHQISCSMENPENLSSLDNPFLSKEDKKILSKRDQQRLIIASQLASDETRFSYLKSFPADYKSITKRTQDTNTLSFFDKIRRLLGYEPSWF